MMLLALSAAFVGLVHSLAPGHWLPVVLMTKAKRWPTRTAIMGAIMAASGHVLVSVTLGILGVTLGAQLLMAHEENIEHYGGLGLVVFGLAYAVWSLLRHKSCHGHEHHGPVPTGKEKRGPFAFLFMLGFSPCVAVLPVFVAAAPLGIHVLISTMVAFAVGVIGALVGATLLVSYGVMRLDHPIFEHYGDVITGVGVAALGLALFLLPHMHGH